MFGHRIYRSFSHRRRRYEVGGQCGGAGEVSVWWFVGVFTAGWSSARFGWWRVRSSAAVSTAPHTSSAPHRGRCGPRSRGPGLERGQPGWDGSRSWARDGPGASRARVGSDPGLHGGAHPAPRRARQGLQGPACVMRAQRNTIHTTSRRASSA